MAIVDPKELRFADKHIIMVLYALPGVGKSTLALSAPKPLWIDVDKGAPRVKPEHRKQTETSFNYAEIRDDIKNLPAGKYETLIIDTMGAMIECLKRWAMETVPAANRQNGGMSQQGYGVVKSEFLRWSEELRENYNVIYVFHAERTKGTEAEIFYDLICEGSAKTIVWQPADIGAFMFIRNGRRYLGFSPQAEYSAKSGYGIKSIIEVPELQKGDPNVFLTQLFQQIRSNLAEEDEAGAAERAKYEAIMIEGREIIAGMNTIEDIPTVGAKIKALGEALTSIAELRGLMGERLKALGIVYDKEAKKYVQVAPKEETGSVPVEGGGLL